MNTSVRALNPDTNRVRNALNREMMMLAARIDAALFLTGSQYYAGGGEDHDYRMVVDDPAMALMRLCGIFPNAARLATAAQQWGSNTIGLKFERHGMSVSLQIHARAFIKDLCELRPVMASVLRSSATSASNQVFGFGQMFETDQVHRWVGPGACWLVEIDQNPWLHGEFCTQIYHNMVLGCTVMRNRHGFARMRRLLIRRVAREARRQGIDPVVGFMQLMARNRERWTPLKSAAFAAEISAATRRIVHVT